MLVFIITEMNRINIGIEDPYFQNGLYARLHSDLTEGQRAGGYAPPWNTAVDKRRGIRLFDVTAHLLYDLFIAGKLNISAKQNICYPQNGIEPINRQKQKEGKKRMRQLGSVEVPQEAFMAVLKLDE